MKKLEEQMAKLIPEKLQRLRITREMQKLVLMESETIVRKITSGIVQPECCIVTMSKASIFWYLLSHSPVCVRGVGCGPQWGLLINNNNNNIIVIIIIIIIITITIISNDNFNNNNK